MVSLGYEIGDGQKGALIGRFRELRDRSARLICEGLGALAYPLDGIVFLDKRKDSGKRHFLVTTPAQYCFD